MSIVTEIPAWLFVGLSVIPPFLLWAWLGLSGEWNDQVESPEWLVEYVRWPRIRWLQAGFVALFVMVLLYVIAG